MGKSDATNPGKDSIFNIHNLAYVRDENLPEEMCKLWLRQRQYRDVLTVGVAGTPDIKISRSNHFRLAEAHQRGQRTWRAGQIPG